MQLNFPWSEEDPDNVHSACCKLCKTTFNIGSMGRTAFISHAKGIKHGRSIGHSVCAQPDIETNIASTSQLTETAVEQTSQNSPTDVMKI